MSGDQIAPLLTVIGGGLIVVFIVLAIAKSFIWWLFGIGEIIGKQQEQIDYLKRIADQLAPIQQQAPPPPPQPTSQPQRRTPGRYTLQQRP